MKGIVVSWDGLDGSGKTTDIEAVRSLLKADGLSVWSGKIRPLVGTSRLFSVEAIEAYCQRLRQTLNRLAGEFDVVLLDRSPVTFLAHWAYWKGVVSPEAVWEMAKECFASLSVVLDLPIEVCRERLRQRGEDPYPLEESGEDNLLAFQRNLQSVVEFLRPRLGNRLVVLDNNEKAIEWVCQTVRRLRTHFDLHLTNACPLKCPTCCFGAGEGAKTAQAIDSRLKEIVDAGLEAGISEFHLLGGEPLVLGERLVSLMRYIREQGGRTHLLTTGYSLRHADEVLPLADAVFVSLDGPRQTHNRTRGLPIFDNACQFIQRARDFGCRIRIGTVVSRLNIATATQVVDVLEKVGVTPNSLCWMNMSPTGGLFAGQHGDRAISPAALENYLSADEWLEFVESLAADERLRALPWAKVEPAFSNRPELFGCELLQGKRRVMVMSDGSMYLCPMLTPLPSDSNILEGDPVAALVSLLSWTPEQSDLCGDGCLGGCLGYAWLFGNDVCDARCQRQANCSKIPGQFRLSKERLAEGYRPICPCRTVRVKDL